MGDWNSTVPSVAAGDELPASKVQTGYDIDTALTNAWTTWTPTLANLTQGNATVVARYRRLGKTVDFRFKFKLGSTSAVGTAPTFTLPFTPSAEWAATPDFDRIGTGTLFDTSATAVRVVDLLLFTAPNIVAINHWNGTATTVTNATVPWTWATGDTLSAWGTYYTD